MLEKKGWTLVQPLLSSSHLGYGISSLQKDSDELDMLLRFLARKWGWDEAKGEKQDYTNVIIVGHSTGSIPLRLNSERLGRYFCLNAGCQDAIWHSTHGKEKSRITGLVLQVRLEALIRIAVEIFGNL